MKFNELPLEHRLSIQTALCTFQRYALDLVLRIAKKFDPTIRHSKSKSQAMQLLDAMSMAEWEQVPNCHYTKGEIIFAVTDEHELIGFLLYSNTSTTYSLLDSDLSHGAAANALSDSLKGKAPVSIGILGPKNIVLATYRFTPT